MLFLKTHQSCRPSLMSNGWKESMSAYGVTSLQETLLILLFTGPNQEIPDLGSRVQH